jgi:hypothetical protein
VRLSMYVTCNTVRTVDDRVKALTVDKGIAMPL